MQGRKPKPPGTALGHRRPPDRVIVGGRGDLAELDVPPDHLCEDARRFWAEYVPHLTSIGLVDRVDVPGLEMLATSYARWVQANRVVNADGLFEATARGGLKMHTALRIETEARDAFHRIAEQF